LLAPSALFSSSVIPFEPPVVEGPPSGHITVNKRSLLNLATTNFLGLVTDSHVKQAASEALKKYGCGACGPRGFYGTIDVHLKLEKELAAFMNTEEGILYSSAYATMPALIPTFSGRSDILIVDEHVSHAIRVGVELSRSDVYWFQHNDMADLQRQMEKVHADQKAKKRPLTRRFVVVEGLYLATGEITPLDKLMQLSHKYCFRVMLDDSLAVGCLGKTGRGTSEHFNIAPEDRPELIAGDLGHALASAGGFCVGDYAVVYHQRLNSSGYVFSAASPPYLVSCARAALEQLQQRPALVQKLQDNARRFRKALKEQLNGSMQMTGSEESPLIHLRLPKPAATRVASELLLQRICDAAADQGLALTRAKHIPAEKLPPPSIRLTVMAEHSASELEDAARKLAAVAKQILA